MAPFYSCHQSKNGSSAKITKEEIEVALEGTQKTNLWGLKATKWHFNEYSGIKSFIFCYSYTGKIL